MQPTNGIKNTIMDEDFFAIDEDDALRLIQNEFGEELDRLKRAYSIRDTKRAQTASPSPSVRLFGADYDEVNRTLVGILALRWIHTADYGTFVHGQPAKVRLQQGSFDWICEIFTDGIRNSQDLDTLITSMMINDLGKDPDLARDYRTKTGVDISGQNHDAILLRAAEAGLVPSFSRLPKDQQRDLLLGLRLGAELNFGQLAQAENVPASLSGLIDMRGHPRAFRVHFMEQLLDFAGAAGHVDHTCALKLIEPVFQAYKNVHGVAL